MYQFLQEHPRLARVLDVVGAIVLVNMAAILVALLIVTIPPAIAGTFGYMLGVTRKANVDLAKDFFGVMRSLFWKSWAVAAISIVAWGGAFAVVHVVSAHEIPFGGAVRTLWLVAAVGWLIVSFYVWPALVLIERPLGALLALSARLAFGHIYWSLAMLVATAAALWLGLRFPIAVALGLFSGLALLVSAVVWHVMRRYIPAASASASARLPQPPSTASPR